MITLFDNPFSPFARKVRLVLLHKNLEFDTVDGLLKSNHQALGKINGRVEVPALVDDGVSVVNSADIVNYLEHRYPGHPIYPASPLDRVNARAWERCADTLIDPILVNVSYWQWAERPDEMPEGLFQAAKTDMCNVFQRLEHYLDNKKYICGEMSIADLALFPHLASTKSLGLEFSAIQFPKLTDWFSRMRGLPMCVEDLKRTRAYLSNLVDSDVERTKLFWRGDRIEWLLSHGFHGWFMNEIKEERVAWPGSSLPPKLKD